MPNSFKSFFFLCFLLTTACTPKSQTELSRSLEAAVKDNKISLKKMEKILSEYALLRKEDKEKAGEYVLKILNVIKMGGDSSHIDVVRNQVLVSKKSVSISRPG